MMKNILISALLLSAFSVTLYDGISKAECLWEESYGTQEYCPGYQTLQGQACGYPGQNATTCSYDVQINWNCVCSF